MESLARSSPITSRTWITKPWKSYVKASKLITIILSHIVQRWMVLLKHPIRISRRSCRWWWKSTRIGTEYYHSRCMDIEHQYTFQQGKPTLLGVWDRSSYPIEVEIPSMRILMETKLEEDEWIQNRFDQLNLIDEKRITAVCHGQLYQKRLKKAFDKKLCPWEFREGYLVLKKNLPLHKGSREK